METVKAKFLKYIKIDSKSNPDQDSTPSSNGQFLFANTLKEELLDMGLDVKVDNHCYLVATLPSNLEKEIPVIGFISHLDTSPDMSATNVKPKIIENYDGKDIVLNSENNLTMIVSEFPELKKYIGQTIITTDGTTLLGADDKAGVAEIMTAIQYLVQHPEIKHGTVKIGFTPDEEIGKGADFFDVKKFGAKYAYTVDGGELGELEFENFNAANLKVNFKGRNIHPGTAKNLMINSIQISNEFNNMLPCLERAENTDGYQGFFHLHKIEGTVEKTTAEYLIRDHDKINFEKRKTLIYKITNILNDRFGEDSVTFEMKDSYFNMKEKIEAHFHIIKIAEKAMIDAGVVPIFKPVRGGTDGSRLSFMGLPCPNLFAGGHNFHGRYEFIPVQSMEKSVQVILNIINEFATNYTE